MAKKIDETNGTLLLKPIARIHTDFPSKFGLPRQGEVSPLLKGLIVFEKEFRKEGILRGLEEFSYVWLIWGFSEEEDSPFSPTIRPPKLGGNTRVGVFASRSPNRPNPIGLTCAKIEEINLDGKDAPTLLVSGVDMEDNTPIYDIKPYVPYADSFPEAKGGFSKPSQAIHLDVVFLNDCDKILSPEKREVLISVLSQDPRPGYKHDSERIYGFSFSNYTVRFKVEEEKRIIVLSIA